MVEKTKSKHCESPRIVPRLCDSRRVDTYQDHDFQTTKKCQVERADTRVGLNASFRLSERNLLSLYGGKIVKGSAKNNKNRLTKIRGRIPVVKNRSKRDSKLGDEIEPGKLWNP